MLVTFEPSLQLRLAWFFETGFHVVQADLSLVAEGDLELLTLR